MDGFLAKPLDVGAAVALITQLTGHAAAAADMPPDPHAATAASASEPSPAAGEALGPAQGSDVALQPQRAVLPAGVGQAWPGLDVEQASARWGDMAQYQRELRLFAREHCDGAQAMAGATPANAAEQARRLKETAAQLSLGDVRSRAEEAELVFKTGLTPGPTLAALQAALDTALESIRRFAGQD
jgi:hypothetical protein